MEKALAARQKELDARTPNPDQYFIEKAERVGKHLVLKIKYPSCVKCAYEGSKVMVILNVTESQALAWRRCDPHFRQPIPTQPGRIQFMPQPDDGIMYDDRQKVTEMPSPAARFPASDNGWQDALDYAATR